MDSTSGRRMVPESSTPPLGASGGPASAHGRYAGVEIPLSESELGELGAILASVSASNSMTVEELDGFFAALIAGPAVAKPCQYWPVVFGRPVADSATLDFIRNGNPLLPLFARHWHTILTTLGRGEGYLPYLCDRAVASASGYDWARGFMRAVGLRRAAWSALFDNEEDTSAILPMMLLVHESDPDPALRPAPVSAEQRDEIVGLMTLGLVRVYRFFHGAEPNGRRATSVATATIGQRMSPCAPCPCGSEKAYRECCEALNETPVH